MSVVVELIDRAAISGGAAWQPVIAWLARQTIAVAIQGNQTGGQGEFAPQPKDVNVGGHTLNGRKIC